MTYVGPYTQATLISRGSELEEEFNSVKVATPGTLLDYIGRTAPHFLQIIQKANMLPFYNTISLNKYTVFVPVYNGLSYPMFDANTARRICQKSTVPGVVTSDMLLSSRHLILYSLYNDSNEINVTSDENGILLNNNQNLLYGDIQCTNGLIHVVDKILC